MMYCLNESSDDQYEIFHDGSASDINLTKSIASKGNFKFSIGDQLLSLGYYSGLIDSAIYTPLQYTLIK